MRRYTIAPGVARMLAEEGSRPKREGPYLPPVETVEPVVIVIPMPPPKRSPRPRPVVVGQQEMVF